MQGTTGSSLHLLYVKLPRASISSSVAGKSSTIGEIGARGGWTLRRSSCTKCLVLHRGVPGICGLLLYLYHRVGLAGISKGDLHHRLTTKLLSINVRDSLRGPPKRSISKSRYTCIATIHGNVCESRITLSSSKRYAALKEMSRESRQSQFSSRKGRLTSCFCGQPIQRVIAFALGAHLAAECERG